jgi:hypothetical protein
LIQLKKEWVKTLKGMVGYVKEYITVVYSTVHEVKYRMAQNVLTSSTAAGQTASA